METRHIKLGYEEALFAKKQLLSTELNFLRTVKKIRTYKLLRKKELITKNNIKTALNVLKTKINLIQASMPEQEKPKTPKIRARKIETKQRKDIKRQLDEINEKLKKLA